MTTEMTAAIVKELGMTEFAKKLGVVWERFNNWGDKNEYRAVTRVAVQLDGSVSITQFSRGPRGGYQSGGVGPGFSAEEWSEITARVNRAQVMLLGNAKVLADLTREQRNALAMELPRGENL